MANGPGIDGMKRKEKKGLISMDKEMENGLNGTMDRKKKGIT